MLDKLGIVGVLSKEFKSALSAAINRASGQTATFLYKYVKKEQGLTLNQKKIRVLKRANPSNLEAELTVNKNSTVSHAKLKPVQDEYGVVFQHQIKVDGYDFGAKKSWFLPKNVPEGVSNKKKKLVFFRTTPKSNPIEKFQTPFVSELYERVPIASWQSFYKTTFEKRIDYEVARRTNKMVNTTIMTNVARIF